MGASQLSDDITLPKIIETIGLADVSTRVAIFISTEASFTGRRLARVDAASGYELDVDLLEQSSPTYQKLIRTINRTTRIGGGRPVREEVVFDLEDETEPIPGDAPPW